MKTASPWTRARAKPPTPQAVRYQRRREAFKAYAHAATLKQRAALDALPVRSDEEIAAHIETLRALQRAKDAARRAVLCALSTDERSKAREWLRRASAALEAARGWG